MNIILQTKDEVYMFEEVKYIELLNMEQIHISQDGSVPAIVITEVEQEEEQNV